MGAEYRGGEYYGSSTTINDNVISEKSTWSSEKIAGQIDDISVTGNKTWSSWEINARINEKADSSVIAPVETDVRASRAYAIGEHFIKNGKFCTAKTAIAQNEVFTLNTNYTTGDVDDDIKTSKDRIAALETVEFDTSVNGVYIKKTGNIVCVRIVMGSTGITADGIQLPSKYKPDYVYVPFIGKAYVNGQDKWDQGFRIDTNGLLTARSMNGNSSISCNYVQASVTYIL